MQNQYDLQTGKPKQNIGQKLNVFTEEMRLKGLISGKEQELSSCFNQLGRAYYDKRAAQPMPELGPLVRFITDTLNAIQAYKVQIRQLRNIGTCVNCGAEIPGGHLFCGKCGHPIPKPSPPPPQPQTGENVCPNCRARLLPTAAFCNACGMKTASPVVAQPPERRCPSCGAVIKKDTVFCAKCGSPVESPDTEARAEKIEAKNESTPNGIASDEAIRADPVQVAYNQVVHAAAETISEQDHRCQHCGKTLLPNAQFCLGCGKPVKEAADPPEQADICKHCGQELLPDALFCLNCGKRV